MQAVAAEHLQMVWQQASKVPHPLAAPSWVQVGRA